MSILSVVLVFAFLVSRSLSVVPCFIGWTMAILFVVSAFVFQVSCSSFVVSAVLVGMMTILCVMSVFCVLGVLLFVCGVCWFGRTMTILFVVSVFVFQVWWLLFCIDDGYSLRYVRCLLCCTLTYPCWCSIVLYRQQLRCALCSVLCFRCRLLCLGCPTCLVGTMAMVRAMSYVFLPVVLFFCYQCFAVLYR